MRHNFEGWEIVAASLLREAEQGGTERCALSPGQCASLRGIAERLPHNGMVIADEVGMGKTRIAVVLARSVVAAGGRVAILIPPGLGFQWQDELRTGGVEAPGLLRNLWPFFDVWMPDSAASRQPSWLERDVVLVSHAFTNWHLGMDSPAWRWVFLPALYAHWKKVSEGRFPPGFNTLLQMDDRWSRAPLQAGEAIASALGRLSRSHPLRRVADELLAKVHWPDTVQPANYGRHGIMRSWLECAVGLGLGSFDLIIIDEAHKSRGDESGLSRILDQVVVAGRAARRLGMTATPVELDASQWHQTLDRIGASKAGISTDGEDIFQRYVEACARVRQYPNNSDARDTYRMAAGLFQETLTPYLLRRDKQELECVQIFAERSGLSHYAYRQFKEISVETTHLPQAWQEAVCAAEALSIVTSQADDAISKRLRLTMGNGHGIAALLDHVKQDATRDRQQVALDGDVAALTAPVAPDKRRQRADWWKQVIVNAFTGDTDPLYDHPAILAVVDEIEQITATDEKVLVFGRFTLPLHALVLLLNARAMLRALGEGTLLPQRVVHQNEWPAIQAAHRQLGLPGAPNRGRLDDQLDHQYSKLENQRRQGRAQLIGLLSANLQARRSRSVFEAFCKAVDQHDGTGESPLVSVANALHALTGLTADEHSISKLTAGFEDLIEAACEKSEGDEDRSDRLDESEATQLWVAVQERIAQEYNRAEGGFARLMYGDTPQTTRRLLQLAFNRSHSHPRVLVAQSVVGREGLNLHQACRTVILLHPEWNPGVVEQQIGRVDRIGSQWERDLAEALQQGAAGEQLPRIVVRPVIFRGTYDERNWEVLQLRWDDLRAQLHGIVIPPDLARRSGLPVETVAAINRGAPDFRPH